MKYIVFDMEWNQTRGQEEMLSDGRLLTGEIIEIGAVKLNDNFVPVDTFKTYIQPIFYHKMHSRVKKLTGITNELLKDAPMFDEAMEMFLDFCGDEFETITWGDSDIPVLKENLSAHKMKGWSAKNYDLQTIYLKQTENPARNIALETAAEALGIEFTENLHDALIDAAITALISKKLDMRKGVDEYVFKIKDLSELDHIGFETVKKLDNLQKLRSDPRIKYTVCPYCKRPMLSDRIVSQSSAKKLLKASCPEHGEFLILLKLHKQQSGKYTASKYVYEWNDDIEELYNTKLEAADKKKDKFLARVRAKK